MSLQLVVAVTQRHQPSVHPVRCSAAQESVFTKSGGVMETPTARMAAMKPTVVCTTSCQKHLKINYFKINTKYMLSVTTADHLSLNHVL